MMILRRAEARDIPSLIPFMRNIWETSSNKELSGFDVNSVAQSLLSGIQHSRYEVVVVSDDTEIIALSVNEISPCVFDLTESTFYMRYFYVAETHRKQNIANKILNKLTSIAQELGCQNIVTSCLSTNEELTSILQNKNFHETDIIMIKGI